MQQIERKNNMFSLHGRVGNSVVQTMEPGTKVKPSSRPGTTIPKIPGCALRYYLVSAPNHIRDVCRKMIEEYKVMYSAVSDRTLLQYVVSDLLNPSSPLTSLHKLLASGHGTPGEVLEELRRCGHAEILERIAEHQNVREETLLELACDPEPTVRCAVAENKRTPLTAIWQLSVDPCADVRYRQAECLTTPLRILARHLADENPYVSYRARKTLTMHGLPTSIDD